MNIKFTIEKRLNTYCVVMDYPERKKGEGVVFYSNPRRLFCSDWILDNTQQTEENEQ